MKELIGQDHLTGPDGLLTLLVKNKQPASLILWGPPGTGKTTSMMIMANILFGTKKVKERVMELNASDDRGINVVRTKIMNFAKENLSAAKVQYEISKKQIEAAESRFKSGVIPKGDLLNTQSTAATNLQTVISQENALDLALLNLAQLLQVSVNGFDVSPINVGTPSANLFYKNSSTVYNKSLDRMPEIARAKLAIESADLGIEITKSAFLPSVSASAALSSNYGFNLKPPAGFSNETLSNQLSDNFFEMDLSDLSPGIYYLQIMDKSDEELYAQTIIKI